MQSIGIFLVLLSLRLISAQDITSNSNTHQDYHQLRGSSNSSNEKQAYKRNRRRRLYNLYQNRSTSLNSACEPGEVAFGISILADGNNQARISWSVESSDGAVTQSSPLFVSHASIYNQELCFDENTCHRFTLNDSSTTSFPLQNDNSITSIRISINGLTVLENPGHTLTSFSFKFGQCESISKNNVHPSPTNTGSKTETETSQSPSPASSRLVRSAYAAHEHQILRNGEQDRSQISKRCETEILIIIALLLFIVVPRISSLFCCLTTIVGARKYYMNGEEEQNKRSDDTETVNLTSHSFDESTHSTINLENDEKKDSFVVESNGVFQSLRKRFISSKS